MTHAFWIHQAKSCKNVSKFLICLGYSKLKAEYAANAMKMAIFKVGTLHSGGL